MQTHLLSEHRRDHRPPEGMVNASGSMVVDLARGVQELLKEPFDRGMQADLAAMVLATAAVDVWRANYGDGQCREALLRAVERRLEKPPEYWGAKPERRGA